MSPVVRGSLALALLVVASTPSLANGRLPGPVNLRRFPGNDDRLLLGATFGLVEVSESGATARWVCEDAVGYGGEYDPDYAFHPTRDEIWATTFEGLRVSRDGGCTWDTIGAPFGEATWIGEVEIGSDGRVWAATSSGKTSNDVYVSSDGVEFTSVGLTDATGWWESIRIAPQDPDLIYVSGYRTMPEEDGYLEKSTNGGETWEEVPETNIVFGADPRMMVLGISPDDPNIVFIRVLNTVEPAGDSIYRTTDGGTTWHKVLDLANAMRGFAISPDGQTVYAGNGKLCATDEPLLADGAIRQKGCLYKSTNAGETWVEAGYSPRLFADNTPNTSNALAIAADGTLYAGGSNGVDGWLVGKSTDGAETFTKVLSLSDVDGPLECEAMTDQAVCASLIWPSLCLQNFICEAPEDAGVTPDAGTGAGGGGGCCAVAPTPAQMAGCAVLVMIVGAVLLRRRRG
jgi:photosystem II stability/assembly factor-like uncharacterized protein